MTETLNRFFRLFFTLGSGLIVAGSPLCHSSETPSVESPPKTIQTQIKGYKVYEECLPLKARQSLSYQYSSSQQLVFNVHYHDHTTHNTIYLVEPTNSAILERQSYSTTTKQIVCLMWENNNSTSVMLNYQQQIRSTETN